MPDSVYTAPMNLPEGTADTGANPPSTQGQPATTTNASLTSLDPDFLSEVETVRGLRSRDQDNTTQELQEEFREEYEAANKALRLKVDARLKDPEILPIVVVKELNQIRYEDEAASIVQAYDRGDKADDLDKDVNIERLGAILISLTECAEKYGDLPIEGSAYENRLVFAISYALPERRIIQQGLYVELVFQLTRKYGEFIMVARSAARDIAARKIKGLDILVIDMSDTACKSPIKMFHVTCCIRMDGSLP